VGTEKIPSAGKSKGWPAPPSKLKNRLKRDYTSGNEVFLAMGSVNSDALLHLQRTIGNQAIRRMLNQSAGSRPNLNAFAPIPSEASLGQEERDNIITAGLQMQISCGDELIPQPGTVVQIRLSGFEGPSGYGMIKSPIPGENTARHSEPNHALLRSLELDYSGKTVHALRSMKGFKPHPDGFKASVFDMIKREWDYIQYQIGLGAEQSKLRSRAYVNRHNRDEEEDGQSFGGMFEQADE
jgi:hypothetical protein